MPTASLFWDIHSQFPQGFLGISCPAVSTPLHPPPFATIVLFMSRPPTANRITWKVLGLQDPLQLYCPGLLPDKQGSHQTRPEALGPRKELPSLWRMGLAQVLQEGEITSGCRSGKASRRK